MNALFRRELRRQAPYAGAVALFGFLLLALGPLVSRYLLPHERPNLSAACAFTLLIGAGLLAVGTVAPDRGTGGIAFLARLPLSPGRTLAIKTAAAALLLAGQMALLGIAFAIGTWISRDDLSARTIPALPAAALVVFAFGASLLASVLAPRTMPALLAAPFVGVAAAAFGTVALDGFLDLQLTDELTEALFGFLAVSLLVASVLAYTRGDAHRSSARPGILAALVLAPVLPTFLLGAAKARAWTLEHATPGYRVGPTDPVRSPDGKHVAVPVVGWLWCGVVERVFVVETATGSSWLVPAHGVEEPIFSPDGRSLLLRGRTTGWLVDLATRRLRPFASFSWEGGSTPSAPSWRDGRPTVPGGGRFIEESESAERNWELNPPRDADWRQLGVDPRDGRDVGWDAKGVELKGPARFQPVFKDGVRELVLAWPEGRAPQSARLAPSGRRLLLANRLAGVALEALDLDSGTFTTLDVGAVSSQADVIAQRASFSPDERRVALELPTKVAFLDVATGRCLATTPRENPRQRDDSPNSYVTIPDEEDPRATFHIRTRADAATWSPDGRFASPHSAVVVDLENGTSRRLRALVAALLPGERCLLLGEPLATVALAAAEVHEGVKPGSKERR